MYFCHYDEIFEKRLCVNTVFEELFTPLLEYRFLLELSENLLFVQDIHGKRTGEAMGPCT